MNESLFPSEFLMLALGTSAPIGVIRDVYFPSSAAAAVMLVEAVKVMAAVSLVKIVPPMRFTLKAMFPYLNTVIAEVAFLKSNVQFFAVTVVSERFVYVLPLKLW